MKKLAIYQVDAFTSHLFAGNPAAVCPLDEWLDDASLQKLAAENNLSETAFFVPSGEGCYHLRWFTPTTEVRLCGHATLATAHVLFNELKTEKNSVNFQSLSGDLSVSQEAGKLWLNFPVSTCTPCPELLPEMSLALGQTVLELFKTEPDYNLYAILDSAHTVTSVDPDYAAIAAFHPFGTVVTALGVDVDFVSRYFAPSYGISEDPVTGSIHTALTPLWSGKLDKQSMQARQVSARGGQLSVTMQGDRVLIGGHCVTYMSGEYRHTESASSDN
ncbi:MAG: PhzF family phenazine biosynthesis protein [Hahellaceae bacterium]|nr:PhzF family phenazine biosynthesis protein [Hahellaceae bacterium]MCP5212704.1 PhzF family phenazine biosynthesis protein [Hahellaceae bacterium]